MENKFQGKTSIITGASSGIGRETAIEFSKLGAQLVLVGRNEAGLDETIASCMGNNSENILKIVGDLVNIETCNKTVEECLKKFNKINHLVTNSLSTRFNYNY
jgi:NADP-dependent 3-hydroxy acid dehydrogenase YdfG